MKPFIIGITTVLLSVFVLVFSQDYRLHNYYVKELKYVCEEASASAALFLNMDEYSQGRIVFNYEESDKAVRSQIRNLLRLDNNCLPLNNSYWTDAISYKIYYFDDSNTYYPYLFKDIDTLFTHVVTDPCVIVTINAGRANYRIPFLSSNMPNIVSAAHEYVSR